MTCHYCGCETPFGLTHTDSLACAQALKRENETLRRLLCMSLIDEVADDCPDDSARMSDQRLSPGAPA
jgi:hypothetical protein